MGRVFHEGGNIYYTLHGDEDTTISGDRRTGKQMNEQTKRTDIAIA